MKILKELTTVLLDGVIAAALVLSLAILVRVLL